MGSDSAFGKPNFAPALPPEAKGEALPCGPHCPSHRVCDDFYRDNAVPDHCERCLHPQRCHAADGGGGE